ncbi:MAG: hypothetical protein A3J48_02250 [Candidatus Doudnabacteria bacterium RIFCSPHIGHO2_02_FULL_46_11]|uniref:Type II secretion system protein GspG C-terminal domain-containing protein n=1 Tax=Candidatus Doudnabacteria bacterium RIFCSPHIGHO2_02_FULL_46_11 TaxID=1817832 RepID=A0A1F5P8Z9_9BACT|nr:MAG: hypothetical protein A3J48_02250 [Candidatus Doudnabacteria bacterium RIFCSPHIGHO2_02_FULL_46_11]
MFLVNHKTKNKNLAFTLVELLVVIAIIGLLASFTYASVNVARARARDARRHEDIKALQTALQLYYEDNGQYPDSGIPTGILPGWSLSNESTWSTLQTELAPYLAQLPIDPAQPASGSPLDRVHVYSYNSNGPDECDQQQYFIVYILEIPKGPDPGFNRCASPVLRYGGSGLNTIEKTVGNKQINQ